MDFSRWRKLTKMVDDQERCKWVNVSSGTGSPRQSPIKGRKTVVIVVDLAQCAATPEKQTKSSK